MRSAAVTSLDRYRRSLHNVVTLTPEAERELALAWKRGDQRAGERLVEASLPFVIRIAREYRRWGVPLEDLVQQGNVGLLKAANKFEPSKDCRLITYAVYWIRAEIREYVVRSYRIVRLGTTRTERKAMRAYRRSAVDSVEVLAEESGMPVERAQLLWPLLTQGDVSLDFRPGDRESIVERFANATPNPEVLAMEADRLSQVRAQMKRALAKLTDRERRIVKSRFLSDEPRTLEQLGKELGVSKERVRQIEERVRAKLRVDFAQFSPAA